ncbi:MAG: flavodoxin family protein [Desulfobacteraceae bacterium]|nr:flavodoxin family protein [Desulfobacteraceae bacterium]
MDTKVFLFATHGAAKESDHAKAAMDYAVSLLRGAEVVGTTVCWLPHSIQHHPVVAHIVYSQVSDLYGLCG